MRLYRAMKIGEKILTSDERVFKDNKLNKDISFIDEVYSHIVPTYRLSKAIDKRVIFSFTDDIDIAYKFLNKYPQTYDRIGYVDIDNYHSAFVDDSNLLFVEPVFDIRNWIDLVAYNFYSNSKLVVKNINYKKTIPLINTLTYSRWGALSLARKSREYAVICYELELKIISNKDDVFQNQKNVSKDKPNCNFLSNDLEVKKLIVQLLRKDLTKLKINKKRKIYLDNLLNAYQTELFQ